MEIYKLDIATLTQTQFNQIVTIEKNCGQDPYTSEMLLECIESLDTYACIDGESIAGFITVHPSTRYLGGGLYIVNLNVAKDHRRKGIAQALILSACASYAVSHAGQLVTLDVSKDNSAAMNLYKKLGFQVTTLPSGNGDTDIVMAVALNQLCQEQ